MRRGGDSQAFQPLAVGCAGVVFGQGLQCVGDELSGVCGSHGSMPFRLRVCAGMFWNRTILFKVKQWYGGVNAGEGAGTALRRASRPPTSAALYPNRLATPTISANSPTIAATPKINAMAIGASVGSAGAPAGWRGDAGTDAGGCGGAGGGGVTASTTRTAGGAGLVAGVGVAWAGVA